MVCRTCSDPTFVRFFFFQAEDGIRDLTVTGVQTCALPIYPAHAARRQLRPGVLPRLAQEKNPRRNRARPRRIPARILPPAPPQSAQPPLDEEERLVRARSAAAAAANVQSRPPGISSSQMKLIGSRASPY